METLLYKPLFINPQAYYVFPNINGRLEPKTGSGKEPAIFVGNIEVKTIAHGDIGKKQYFYNTNEIDLSAFSNSLVRISLYTSRGNVVLGEWNLDVVEGESEDYIDPEILDSLCGVWIADQNTNESESRSIIKNKIADRGGDLELLNFGYKLNSGYGKYEVDFTIFNDITDCTIIGNKIINHSEVLFKAQYNYEIKRTDVESFNAKVENITKGYIGYTYRDNNGIEKSVSFTPETIKANNGIITLPKSYNTLENSTGVLGGLYGYGVDKGTIITQIPSFEGALVTDGKDDLITSTKTVKEMLGGSNEVTVVSMIHQIGFISSQNYARNNYFIQGNDFLTNTISAIGKIGIYGYKGNLSNIAYADFPITKSPQKISYAIDEYIRYENIVQPYPAIINLKQDGKTITWGDKLKVGSDIVFVGSANLLPELYTVSETRYNGVTLYPNTIIKVEKSMVFDNARTYLKANEPSCILSPNRLRIPNSSYKILGYIPDLTGKGNHGRLNNFAYTEESGANEDGSIRFDGKDDHITIPTLAHGSKCMLMKVNWNKDALMLYDQRRDNNPNSFAIYIPNFNNEDSIAYSSRNDGKTYIDGVLNTSVKGSQLKDVTHNITITNSNSNNDNTVSPAIGSNAKYNTFYAQMVLYEFMLLPDVPDEEEIKELNDIVGIEGNTDDLLTKINI